MSIQLIQQHQASVEKMICFADYKEHVIDLLGRVCAVSVQTMTIIGQMPV